MSEPARLLIVDDEVSNVQALAESLRRDYSVFFALNGEQAQQMVKEKHIDLVLLDVVMPGIDGFEVLRRLKADTETHDVPVIFVTAMSEVEDETRGFALGAVDYVFKPFRPPVVRARIRTHLELKRQRELLEQHAFIDGLTGIGNRRRFDDTLSRRWRAAQRNAEPLSLILLDIDHFKAYNDNYGHAVGDDCLRRVAAALETCFSRGDDLVARYGGEEFAALPAEEPGQALGDHAQRVLDTVTAMAVPHDFSPTAPIVTVSAGALRLRTDATHSPEDLIREADELLYRAKEQGRNQCWHRDELHDIEGVLKPSNQS